MVVKVRALLDQAGRPADWTAEIWSDLPLTRDRMMAALLAE
jgi:hypothetical protein